MLRRLLTLLLVLAVCGLTAWLVFLPVIWALAPGSTSLGEALRVAFLGEGDQVFVVGGGVDLLGTLWTFDRVDLLLRGKSATTVPEMFAPLGFDWGVAQAFAWADAVLAWPLVASLGTPRFYNAHVWVQLCLTQFAAYVAFRSVRAPVPLALALSIGVSLNPFSLGELSQGRPTQAHLVFHGLFLAAVAQIGARPGLQRAIATGAVAGLLLALSCLVYWFSGVAVGVLGGVALLGLCLTGGTRRIEGVVGGLSTIGSGVCVAALASWRLAQGAVGAGDGALARMSALPWRQVAWGPIMLPLGEPPLYVTHVSQVLDRLAAQGLPIVWLGGLMLVVCAPRAWRRTLPWAIAAVFATSLCIGSGISWGTGFVPTAHSFVLKVFPPLARCMNLNRLVVAGVLGLPLVVAVVAGRVWPRGGFVPWLLSIPLAALMLQHAPHADLVRTQQIRVDTALLNATRRLPGGIIDVPLERSNTFYVQQVFHRQPVLGGMGLYSTGQPPAHLDYIASNTFLAAVEAAAHSEKRSYTSEDVARLRQDGFSLVAVHLDKAKGSLEDWVHWFGASPVAVDRRIAVFSLPRDPTPEDALAPIDKGN